MAWNQTRQPRWRLSPSRQRSQSRPVPINQRTGAQASSLFTSRLQIVPDWINTGRGDIRVRFKVGVWIKFDLYHH